VVDCPQAAYRKRNAGNGPQASSFTSPTPLAICSGTTAWSRSRVPFEVPRERRSLDGVEIDDGLKATLERLMPIYQTHWWPEHDRVNRAWIAAVQPLLERHGTALSRALTRTYDTTWPSNPVPVDLSVTAGPAGAYTTGPPTHVTISSSDPGYQGLAGLEMLFHESSHSPISDLFQRVREAASEQKVSVPAQLWHGVPFYTAGELTTRELKAHGIAYAQYAGQDTAPRWEAIDCGVPIRARRLVQVVWRVPQYDEPRSGSSVDAQATRRSVSRCLTHPRIWFQLAKKRLTISDSRDSTTSSRKRSTADKNRTGNVVVL
jgi:hypothetical protein